MKQAEKNQRSRDCILRQALAEFAEHGYSGASLNRICGQGSISKGMLYHYYTGKDALYLACVEQMFRDMARCLREGMDLTHVTIDGYFAARMDFFREHPLYSRLFYDVLMYPQTHLAEAIEACRADFDQYNNQALEALLRQEPLAEGVSLELALEQFRAFVHFFGVYLREASADDVEQKAAQLLRTMLYGLIAR